MRVLRRDARARARVFVKGARESRGRDWLVQCRATTSQCGAECYVHFARQCRVIGVCTSTRRQVTDMPRVFFGCSYCERTFTTEEECLAHETPCKDGELKTAAPRATGTRRGGARGRRGRRPRRLDDAIKAISVAYTVDDALRQQCENADVVACLEQLVQTTLDTVDSRVKARKTRSAIGAKQRLLNQLEADELLYGVRSAKKARKSRAPQRLDLDGDIFDDLISGGISAEPGEVSSHDCCELPYPFIRKRARRRYVQRVRCIVDNVVNEKHFSLVERRLTSCRRH